MVLVQALVPVQGLAILQDINMTYPSLDTKPPQGLQPVLNLAPLLDPNLDRDLNHQDPDLDQVALDLTQHQAQNRITQAL